jgi:hypothetical protein
MDRLPIEIQLDSLEEEQPRTPLLSSRDRDRLTTEQDYYLPWLRLINPRVDAYASAQEFVQQFLKLDEQELDDLEF